MDTIINSRLINQQIAVHKFDKIHELVSWLGAIQSQDYGNSKWAIGARIPNITELDIKNEFEKKTIIRTWIFRGTLHIVSVNDLDWILQLISSKVISISNSNYKRHELDETIFSKSYDVLIKGMQNSNHLTRDELSKLFSKSGINIEGLRLSLILHRASIERIICNGSKKGNSQTFALFDEIVPKTKSFIKEEALTNLALKYFSSHGPATIQDFAWWCGLSLTDVKISVENIKSKLYKTEFNNETYWSIIPENEHQINQETYMLPGFDEYILGYKDRTHVINARYSNQIYTKNGIFYPIIVDHGKVIGTWKRLIKKNRIDFEIKKFYALSKNTKDGIELEKERIKLFYKNNF